MIPRSSRCPSQELLSDGFAAERACQVGATALTKPVAPGTPDGDYAGCPVPAAAGTEGSDGQSTTHLTTADRWGNVVAYTLTIESLGGNGIVVPGRGFLLNNELTDFNFTDTQGGTDPNLPGPGKRPRSSMAPTIILADGTPFLALGSPGGSTIITTVLQILVNRLDLGMTLEEAVAAPRATQRNTAAVQAEPGFDRAPLQALGHTFADNPEIGAATAIEFLDDGSLLAVAEPVRRGGGSAAVVRPAPERRARALTDPRKIHVKLPWAIRTIVGHCGNNAGDRSHIWTGVRLIPPLPPGTFDSSSSPAAS